MNNDQFWKIIENAWNTIPKKLLEQRNEILDNPKILSLQKMAEVINKMIIPILEEEISQFSKKNIIAFDNQLSQKLFEIDRQDVADVINGGDDGFLYRRGFVVGMGEKYFNSISSDPSLAVTGIRYWPDTGVSAERMCFIASIIFRKKYKGEHINTSISIETGSNKDYWD